MLPIVEGKYIYFKNFMLRKRDVFIVLAVIFALGAFGVYYYVKPHKTSEEEKIEAIKSGKTDMLDGVVKNINFSENKLILSVSRGLESKDFVINIDKKTEFFVLSLVFQQRPGAFDYEMEYVEEYTPISFDEIKIGAELQVYFKDFIDVETERHLVAKRINVTGMSEPETGKPSSSSKSRYE